MKNFEKFEVTELKLKEKRLTNGGSELTRAILWGIGWIVGSTYRAARSSAQIGRAL